jgi:hypothetical protein
MNELQLFTYLKSRYIPDLLMSSDEFEYHDCYSEQLGVIIELKSRQTHYDELIIERDKYDNITQRAWVDCSLHLLNSKGYLVIQLEQTHNAILVLL